MKIRQFFPVLLFTLITISSCSQKQNKAPVDDKPFVRMDLSQKDTAEVLNLVKTYLGYLQQRDIDKALSMIHYCKGDSILPVPEKIADKQRTSLCMFPAVRYELNHYLFVTEKDCEVKYTAVLFDKDDNDKRPNSISYIIKPVRLGGKWYLTLADHDDPISSQSEISR